MSSEVVPGKHVPWCDSQLGPDFEVRDGEVIMTIFACMGCLPRDTLTAAPTQTLR